MIHVVRSMGCFQSSRGVRLIFWAGVILSLLLESYVLIHLVSVSFSRALHSILWPLWPSSEALFSRPLVYFLSNILPACLEYVT